MPEEFYTLRETHVTSGRPVRGGYLIPSFTLFRDTAVNIPTELPAQFERRLRRFVAGPDTELGYELYEGDNFQITQPFSNDMWPTPELFDQVYFALFALIPNIATRKVDQHYSLVSLIEMKDVVNSWVARRKQDEQLVTIFNSRAKVDLYSRVHGYDGIKGRVFMAAIGMDRYILPDKIARKRKPNGS